MAPIYGHPVIAKYVDAWGSWSAKHILILGIPRRRAYYDHTVVSIQSADVLRYQDRPLSIVWGCSNGLPRDTY